MPAANSAWIQFTGSMSASVTSRPSVAANPARPIAMFVDHIAMNFWRQRRVGERLRPRRRHVVAEALEHRRRRRAPRRRSRRAATPPVGWTSISPMRKRPGSAPTSSAYGRAGGGAMTVSPMPGPRTASSRAAESRTVRLTQCSTLRLASARTGPIEVRPWLGLSPTRPHAEAGMRMLPPPSDALANGTMPAATAAAAPPLDPPGVRVEVPRVVRRAPRDRLRRREAAHLRAVRAPGDDEPGRLVARDQRRVGRVDDRRVAQGHAAVGEGLPGEHRVEVLEQERHAAERPGGQVGDGGDLPGVVEPRDRQRVDGGVDRLHPLDRRLQQLARCDVALGDQRGLVDGVHPAGLVGEVTHAVVCTTHGYGRRRCTRPSTTPPLPPGVRCCGTARSPPTCSRRRPRRSPRRCRPPPSASRSTTSPTASSPSGCSGSSSSCPPCSCCRSPGRRPTASTAAASPPSPSAPRC